ncbi:hypothetical protein B0H16DRAFT_964695 [Mycena metata]|uniref:HNH nuclease domain-containing protein n=1 Tax=Mycena metata TaxID=1033252 RepID=A0AAD7N4P0_9AGAR|nr:hypothetical protein B0H16DRAFT_964695 [Mycena metata]
MVGLEGPFTRRVHNPPPWNVKSVHPIHLFRTNKGRSLSFARLDTTPAEGHPGGGLPYFLVLEIAKILTGNTTGVLVRQGGPGAPVPHASNVATNCLNANPTDTLQPGSYYYFVEERKTDGVISYSGDYELVADFRHWTMPAQLPPYWKLKRSETPTDTFVHSSTADYVKMKDVRCLITGAQSHLHASPLLPQVEKEWLEANVHQLGSVGNDIVDTPANLITLRADLNSHSFDKGEFVIVPVNEERTLFVIRGNSADILETHGAVVALPERVLDTLLYARLALNAFEATKLQRGWGESESGSGESESGSRKSRTRSRTSDAGTASEDPRPRKKQKQKSKAGDDEGSNGGNGGTRWSSSAGPTTPPSAFIQYVEQEREPWLMEKIDGWKQRVTGVEIEVVEVVNPVV